MSESPERAVSGQLSPAGAKKFAEYLANHTQAGPRTVNKYVRIVRSLLHGAPFSIETAAGFCKQKNRSYVRAAVVKYIEYMDHLGDLPEWGPGSADFLIKKLPRVHEPPRKPRKLPEAGELMEVVGSMDKDYRYPAMFMFYTGARSEETMGVRLKDIDFENGDVTIYGKGKIEKAPRVVKVPGDFLQDLRDYTGSLGILGAEYIFLPNSKASMGSRTRMFRRVFAQASKNVLGRILGAHDFRRFAGTTVYEATGDAKAAKDFLGHSKMDTTMRYIEYADRNRTLEKGRDILADVQKKAVFHKDRGEIPQPGRLDRGSNEGENHEDPET